MLIFDGKGDREFLSDLLPAIEAAGRMHQLRVLSPSRPDISVRYNPFFSEDGLYQEHANFVFESFGLKQDFFHGHQATYLSDLVRVLAHTGWIQGATDWPQHAGLKLEDLGIAVPGLTGSVYVERGQYLHLGFDLHLGTNPPWSLSELRKVKFNEKNYFDHPGFGVIAIVNPARPAKAIETGVRAGG